MDPKKNLSLIKWGPKYLSLSETNRRITWNNFPQLLINIVIDRQKLEITAGYSLNLK